MPSEHFGPPRGPSTPGAPWDLLHTVPVWSGLQTVTPCSSQRPWPTVHGRPSAKFSSTKPSLSSSKPLHSSPVWQSGSWWSLRPSQSLSRRSKQVESPAGPSVPCRINGPLATHTQLSSSLHSRWPAVRQHPPASPGLQEGGSFTVQHVSVSSKSTSPSQLLSIPSPQYSVTPGWMAGLASLQSPQTLPSGTSHPPHTTAPSLSASGQSAAHASERNPPAASARSADAIDRRGLLPLLRGTPGARQITSVC